MTGDDWDNLQFLLNASEETFRNWYAKTEKDDHEYAADLFALYREELEVKSALIKDPEIKDFRESIGILTRFRK